ncbi:hypothetical protein NHF48_001200 [Sphingomonas sp. H160509]|uniref:hypothetical protein n=1 Tax=Sphingomonas sp. H160509 TaxID=2955313 RepID=UPI0020969567|nr:hypothetical protein [Sphingomonas sp. H160509]MDD1449866.1 hypothetical protein [Sphingomonas sp. H160509]
MKSGDNDPNRLRAATRPDPDAHGQASLLLVESLLHGMLEKGLLSVDEALGIVTTACEVKEEIASQEIESEDTARYSLHLIGRITASLKFDQRTDPRDITP